MNTTSRRLQNGMTVVLREFRGAPVVSFQLWVKAGSADERPHEAGLAHVLEHMIFKGTDKRKVGEITRDIESAGGSINAWTSLDETVFHITVAAQYAHEGLEVLSDALLHPAFDENELDKELPVICEEIRMGKDSPERMASSELFRAMFEVHPYGRPVIGYQETVENFTAQHVRDFYKRWYTPANMMLIAVGDFSEQETFKKIERLFGEKAKGRSPRRITRHAEPPQEALRIRFHTMSTSDCNLALGVRIPGFEHSDVPALDVLGAVLGQGASSRLELELARKRGLVSEISSVCYTPKDEGMFGVFAKAKPSDVIALTEEVSRQMRQLTQTTCTAKEVEKAKKLILSEDAFSLETVDGQARKLGYFRLYCESAASEQQYIDAVRAVTPMSVKQAAQKYLMQQPSLALVLPESRLVRGHRPTWLGDSKSAHKKLNNLIVQAWKRGQKSVVAARRAEKAVYTHTFDTGDVVIVRPVEAMTVAARAAFMGGQRMETVRYAGVGPLAAALFVRGTGQRSSQEIAEQMDEWACSVSGFSGRNSVGISGEFLRENYRSAMAMMAECLFDPVFDENEMETERTIFKQMVESSLNNARAVAFREFQRRLFGKHPYNRPMYGTLATLDAITQKQLRQYHRKTVQNGNVVLAVVGGVDVDECLALAETHFVRRKKQQSKVPTLSWEQPATPLQCGVDMVKEQSHLVVGFPGTTLDSDDRFAVDVLTEILGGHGGRLFDIVREQESLAYDVSSFSFDGMEPGFIAFYGATSVGKEERFVSLILRELKRLKNQPPPSAELKRVIRFLIGSREISQQRFAARAADLSLSYLYDLGLDSSERYVREISNITAAQVQKIAAKYLNFDQMIVTAVGPGAKKLTFGG
ncbi:MAG: insulinase family protein [Deltaproteobacteria bacterium]|nr:insulinase family protein [Deltaproteobacteria bacterium]MBN2674818.1 insulinase family protein [Deltaproteobacteria bacterium]